MPPSCFSNIALPRLFAFPFPNAALLLFLKPPLPITQKKPPRKDYARGGVPLRVALVPSPMSHSVWNYNAGSCPCQGLYFSLLQNGKHAALFPYLVLYPAALGRPQGPSLFSAILFPFHYPLQVHFKILPVLLYHCLQRQPGKKGLDGRQHGKAADNQRWEIRHIPGFQVSV